MKKLFTYLVALLLSFSAFNGLNAQVNKTINVATSGTLANLLTENEKATVTNLTVTGTINAPDYYTMRDALPSLLVVDLSAVNTEGDSIPYRAFYRKQNLKEVIIPSSVTYIGMEAFESCTDLNNVVIPNSVTSIGYGSFDGCSGLTSVTIPSSVTSIGFDAFGWSGLTSVTIPSSVISIGDFAFGGLSGLTSITIPSSVSFIGDLAFMQSGLTSVTIPSSVTSIGISPFGYSNNLSSIVVDASNTFYSSLDGVLFDKNKTKIIEYPPMKNGSTYSIPSSVTSIGNSAFEGCIGLTSVTIPSSVTSIDAGAFGRSGLTSITIPSSVTSIGRSAFYGCSGLTTITIPSSVTFIGNYPFIGCTNLSDIVVDASNTFYSSLDGVLFDKNKSTIIEYPMKNGSSYSIPSSVTSIGDYAFSGCTGLTTITIPSSVTSIGDDALSGCNGLSTITIPSSVTSIGRSAFGNCSGLQNIKVFGITPVDLSSSSSVFSGFNLETCILFVPTGSKNAYASASQWSGFLNIVEIELSLSQSALVIAAEAGSIATFDISSSVDWNINSNSSWLVPSTTSGFENAMITLTAEANPTSAIREAIVTVSANGLPDKTITVQQFAGTATGIEKNQISSIKVYPIPVNDLLSIEGSSNSNAMIFDMQGKLMISKNLNSETETIDMSLLPQGVYLLKIDGQNMTWIVPK
jgi:hypothetical protein